MTRRQSGCALGLGMTLLAAASTGRADDRPAAQGLFDEGRRLMSAQHYDEACPKFEESQRLDPAVGTLLNLAVCYEKAGRVASAWSAYLDVAAKADAAGQKDRARVGREKAAALAPRVSKIVIAAPSGGAAADLEVTRDGEAVGHAQFGVAVPADPGKHVIAASAPGKQGWSTSVTTTEGQTSTVSVPELAPAGAAATATDTGSVPAPAPAEPPAPPPDAVHRGIGTQKLLALVAGGIGVVGIGIGAGFGIDSLSKHSNASQQCPDPSCKDPTGSALWHDAVTSGNVSTIAFVAGGVVLAGAAVLWFTAKDTPAASANVQMGVGLGSLLVGGSW